MITTYSIIKIGETTNHLEKNQGVGYTWPGSPSHEH